jgi:hypothetical protein
VRGEEEKKMHEEINATLNNWGWWCIGGWPALGYTNPPTSRDYLPKDQRDKIPPRSSPDVVSAEAANIAIANLALNGDTRSYQLIAAWWAHRRPAKQIAKDWHCSLATVYNHRLRAMLRFWAEYQAVTDENRRRAANRLTG